MTKLLTLSFSLFFAISAFAQELNVPKGKTFSYTTSMKGGGNSSYDELYTYSFHSLGKDANGNNVFECRQTNAVTINSGRKEDLTSAYDIPMNTSGILNIWALQQKPFKIIVSSKGKIIAYKGLDEIINSTINKWQLTPNMKQQSLSRKGYLNYSFQKLFFQIPEKVSETAGEWKAKDGTVYKVSRTDDPKLTPLKINPEVNKQIVGNKDKGRFIRITFSGTNHTNESGEYILDSKTGLIQNAKRNRNYDLSYSSVKNQIVDDYKQEIGNDIIAPKIDTAWMDMAVQTYLGSYSEALKTNGKYDQVKMEAYFKANDAKFANDKQYHINKLYAYQGLIARDGDTRNDQAKLRYDSILLATPTHLLYLNNGLHTHLTNKFARYSDTDPQKAYEVAKVFHQTESFFSWLQEATAQHFLGSSEKQLPQQKLNLALMKLMAEDKDEALSSETKPLYLWASAKMSPNDQSLLLKNAAQLAAMDKQTIQKGKGGRYGLLMYQLLLDAGKKNEADKLLNVTISKLQLTVADTTYKYRINDKYMLAHAYYLKYLAEKSDGNSGAIQSLSMAAQYSPSGPGDKNTALFYDKHFLKGKDSYRQDFIEAIFNSGNEQQALKTFASHVSAEPESLLQMKKLYETAFPGKDFKKIFEKDIVGSWAIAPAFKLKDLGDKEHNLNEYLNKWMVIDFWGSWCSPCQAEAPSINAFCKEIADSKTIGFVSIACSDFTQNIIPFMKKLNYTFPVLMSDNHIQGKYKITAVPYKVLVSPTGKMIPIEYGKDWQSILKTFSSI